MRARKLLLVTINYNQLSKICNHENLGNGSVSFVKAVSKCY